MATAPARRGRAGLLLLVLLLLLGSLAGLYYASAVSELAPVRDSLGPGAVQASESAAPIPAAASDLEQLEVVADPQPPLLEDLTPQDRTLLEKSFTGSGSITAVIDVPPDVEFPAYWQLVLEPSRMLQGRDTAVHRVLEFEQGQYEIEKRAYRDTVEVTVDDLPLGGYSISVVAEDMNCTSMDVVLFKVAGQADAPGRQHVRTLLRLEPAGFVDGSLIDGDGLGAEACLLTLESRDGKQRQSAVSGPDGLYLFPTVMNGNYRLIVGNPVRPLVPVRDVKVLGRETRLEEIQLPPTASVLLTIVGPANEYIGEATIRGSGSSGDSIDLVSDGAGEVMARYLRPGRYRLRIQHHSGKSGKATVDVEGSERGKRVEIRIQ